MQQLRSIRVVDISIINPSSLVLIILVTTSSSSSPLQAPNAHNACHLSPHNRTSPIHLSNNSPLSHPSSGNSLYKALIRYIRSSSVLKYNSVLCKVLKLINTSIEAEDKGMEKKYNSYRPCHDNRIRCQDLLLLLFLKDGTASRKRNSSIHTLQTSASPTYCSCCRGNYSVFFLLSTEKSRQKTPRSILQLWTPTSRAPLFIPINPVPLPLPLLRLRSRRLRLL